MHAQGMKTVYQTHGTRLCDVHLLCLTGRTTMYESRAYLRPSTVPRRCHRHRRVNRRLLCVTKGSPSIIVKATDNDESYGNTIVLTVLKNVLMMTALVPFHVRTCRTRR